MGYWDIDRSLTQLDRQIDGWMDHHSADTKALRLHILPSRSPFLRRWKQAWMSLPDLTGEFWSEPGPGINHLFTDGSASRTRTPFDLASWSVTNATTGCLIASGPVTGLAQTNDRAELQAVLSALKWQCRHQVAVHLWIDAKYVVTGLQSLLQHGEAGELGPHGPLDCHH